MKATYYLLVYAMLLSTSHAAAGREGGMEGSVALEWRQFDRKGTHNRDRSQASILLMPEYSRAWNEDRHVFTLAPFFRLDATDSERTHFDLREFSYVAGLADLELRAGVSKVFWGVTESLHLVDVINQTDAVENPDGEDKLGQPMLNANYISPYGNIGAYVLPLFRERTFPGSDGRYGPNVVIDADHAEYTHGNQQRHVDYALRWSHYWGDLEWGVSVFRGTDRDPALRYEPATNRLIPVYGQSRQAGLELQHIYRDLISKVEARYKNSDLHGRIESAVIGFEYTRYAAAGKADLGLLYEWLYDSRHDATPIGTGNGSFVGARLAGNDPASSEALMGVVVDNDDGSLVGARLEASRRFSSRLKLELEINIVGSPGTGSLSHQIRGDDHLQFSLQYFY